MYTALLITHSVLRYFVLLLLIFSIVNSFIGFSGKKPFTKSDDLFSLSLFSLTHTQLLVGLILYFVSPFVQFGGAAMKDPAVRYWTTEHITMMLIAIVLISVGRIAAKKLTDGTAKHRRTLIYNAIALLVILVAIAMTRRGFFSMPTIAS